LHSIILERPKGRLFLSALQNIVCLCKNQFVEKSNLSLSRPFLPIIIVFLVVTVITYAFSDYLSEWGIHPMVVLGGNLVLMLATSISWVFLTRSLSNNRPAVFMRNIYLGIMMKMFICLIAALLYILRMKKEVSLGAIFTLMALYFIYTFMEISILMKLSNQNKNVNAPKAD
jgi:hypothetical protein